MGKEEFLALLKEEEAKVKGNIVNLMQLMNDPTERREGNRMNILYEQGKALLLDELIRKVQSR